MENEKTFETDSKTEKVTGEVTQEKTETKVSEKQADDIQIPATAEEYKKALQSASSQKMNEFLKKHNAAKLSDIELQLEKIAELEESIKSYGDTESKLKELSDRNTELQKIIDEQTPIITQKQQADFLRDNNIKAEYADDFFALYNSKLSEDKSNSDEVIKAIIERHPQLSDLKNNEIKTAGKTSEKIEHGDGLDKIRKHIGLPPQN